MPFKLVPLKSKPTSINTPITPDLPNIPNQELISRYDQSRQWLIDHAAKNGTSNLFDVHGNPYNPQRYEVALKLLELIEDEGRRRQLTGFLTDIEILEVL